MKTKSKGDINAQLDRINKTFYSFPDWLQRIERAVKADEIAERYHENINNYLGDYDIDDVQEFCRRYNLQIDREIYAK